MDSDEDDEFSFGQGQDRHGGKLNEILSEVETKIPSLEFDDCVSFVHLMFGFFGVYLRLMVSWLFIVRFIWYLSNYNIVRINVEFEYSESISTLASRKYA